jgi:glutamate-1-semialdehyde aminotransferase
MSNQYVMLGLASELLSVKRQLDAVQARYDALADNLKDYAARDGVTEMTVADAAGEAKISFTSTMRFNAEEAMATLTPNITSVIVRMKPSVVRADVDRAVKLGLIGSTLEVPHTIGTTLKVSFK